MFGIGGNELFIIAIFVLLIFGPDKLPQMGRTIGKWTKEFRRAQDSMQAQIRAEMEGIERATNPLADSADDKDSKGATGSAENEFEAQARAAEQVDPEWDEEEEEEV